MRVVPRPDSLAVEFYAVHAPIWQAGASSIGLNPGEADEVADLAAAARDAIAAQHQAQQAARKATLDCELAVARLRSAGSACIGRIRAAAASDPAVYSAASLPPPATPGPIAPPGQPVAFDAQFVDNVGALRLTWRCKNPRGSAGTMYEVWRRDETAGGAGGFRFVAIVGEKRFVDETIPAGTPAVEYQVTAVRSTRRGQPARHVVNFGMRRAKAA